MNESLETIRDLFPTARADVPIGPLTTYGVGGPASLAITVKDEAELAELAQVVAQLDTPVLVVGLGSNLLVSDDGFSGLVVVLGPSFGDIEIQGTGVRAGARARLPVVARQSAGAGLTGFEWAAGVPGSVGGAVRMNAGVPGDEMADTLRAVRIVDLASGQDLVVPASELHLGYRASSLSPSQVVVWAELELSLADPEVARAAIKEKTQWRRDHQPGGRNAGSVFANPVGNSAGRLIEHAGCAGLRVGTAEVSVKHANFIQADEGGLANDIWLLMAEVRDRVHRTSGLILQPETVMVGFDPLPVPTLEDPALNDPPDDDPPGDDERLSVEDILDLGPTERLDDPATDRLRGQIEPFLGLVRTLLHDGVFDDAAEATVTYELDHLQREIFEKPSAPLASVVRGYFVDLLQQVVPYLEEEQLDEAATENDLDATPVREIVDSASQPPDVNDEVGQAVEVADLVQELAPEDVGGAKERAVWAAKAVGWISDGYRETLVASGASATVANVLNLSWLPAPWAAVLGAAIGIAGAIAKPRLKSGGDD